MIFIPGVEISCLETLKEVMMVGEGGGLDFIKVFGVFFIL